MQINRRVFLRASAATVMLGACDSSGRGDGTPTTGRSTTTSSSAAATTTAPRTTTTRSSVPANLDALARTLRGPILRPGDARYDPTRLLYSPVFDGTRPQAVIRAAGATDVATTIAYARDHQLPFAVRSGGHSYAGYSTSDGLVIDVRDLASITVNPVAGRARIGAGALLIDVYSTLAAHGATIPGGSCATVGIAGLALGGGHGLTSRKFGLTCDAVRAVDIVTADGVVRRCDRAHDADLFWACRGGGGGNFGVAIAFTFALRETSPTTVFALTFPWTVAAPVLAAWMRWVPTLPDEIFTVARLEATPQPSGLVVAGLHLGGEAELRGLLAPLTAAGSPRNTYVRAKSFADAMLLEAGCLQRGVAACRLPSEGPSGSLDREPPYAATSHYFATPLSDAAIATAMAQLERRNLGGTASVQFDSYGGAINRVASDATAFVHRDTFCSAQYASFWSAQSGSSTADAHRGWLRDLHAAMEPFSNHGAYQNYIDPQLANWQDAYYGTNLDRLRRVKRHYDPDNVFRFAQSIPVR